MLVELLDLKIDFGQGYLFGEPKAVKNRSMAIQELQSIEEISDFLRFLFSIFGELSMTDKHYFQVSKTYYEASVKKVNA